MSKNDHKKHTNGKGPAALAPASQQPDINLTPENCFASNTEELTDPIRTEPSQSRAEATERLDVVSLAFFAKAKATMEMANAQMALFQQVVTEQYGLTQGDQITPEGFILRLSQGAPLSVVPGGLGE